MVIDVTQMRCGRSPSVNCCIGPTPPGNFPNLVIACLFVRRSREIRGAGNESRPAPQPYPSYIQDLAALTPLAGFLSIAKGMICADRPSDLELRIMFFPHTAFILSIPAYRQAETMLYVARTAGEALDWSLLLEFLFVPAARPGDTANLASRWASRRACLRDCSNTGSPLV
ncbi:hypothetical protein SCUP234_03070 [Seiridium cupressi]